MAPPSWMVIVLLCAGLVSACGDGRDGGDGRAAPERPSPAAAERRPSATPPAEPAASPTARAAGWTHGEAIRRLDGRRIAVGRRRVRLGRATLACSGLGDPGRLHGRRVWSAFRCVQPTFPPGKVVGPDAVFVVGVTGRRAFEVRRAGFTAY